MGILSVAHSIQFTQDTPASTWNINHGLGCYPAVDVYINISGVLTKILPMEITHTDSNNTVVTFSTTRSGVARLV